LRAALRFSRHPRNSVDGNHAASIAVTAPLILSALIFQRRVVARITSGALKG
jgi:hypothetical protein